MWQLQCAEAERVAHDLPEKRLVFILMLTMMFTMMFSFMFAMMFTMMQPIGYLLGARVAC